MKLNTAHAKMRRLIIDGKRHNENMHLPFEWPRISQFQECFTAEKGKSYSIVINGSVTVLKGEDLLKGINLKIKKDNSLKIDITPL